MANTKEAKRDLIPHITFPIPSLKDIPRPADKEQRIKTIIANLDKHHQTARLSIIEAAKLRLEEEHQALEQNRKEVNDEDNMDLSPISPPDGTELFLSNLHAPYHESMGDPCYYNNKNNSAPSSGGAYMTPAEKEREKEEQEEKMSKGVPQKTPPVEIRLARETLAQIALYDAHALPARKFYTDALSRSIGGGGVGGVGGGRRESTMISNSSPRRVSSTGGGGGLVAAIDPSWRSGSTTAAATTTGYTTSRTGSATLTAGRVDPRLANRSGSGTMNVPLAQSPGERESARPSDPRLRGR